MACRAYVIINHRAAEIVVAYSGRRCEAVLSVMCLEAAAPDSASTDYEILDTVLSLYKMSMPLSPVIGVM